MSIPDMSGVWRAHVQPVSLSFHEKSEENSRSQIGELRFGRPINEARKYLLVSVASVQLATIYLSQPTTQRQR